MLTVPEAARRIGRNPQTVRRWIRSGRLPADRLGTQHLVRETTWTPSRTRTASPCRRPGRRSTRDWSSRTGSRSSATGAVATELVIDSGVAVRAAGSAAARQVMRRYRLVAPQLLWSEVTSAVGEARWRREITAEHAALVAAAFEAMDVTRMRATAPYRTAATVADELGWA